MRYSSSAAAASIKRATSSRLLWGLVLAALTIVLLFELQRAHAISVYRAALLRAHTHESVSIGGQAYDVVNGTIANTDLGAAATFRILSLAYEKALAERSPLFALPGVDPESFASTISALHDSEEAFAKAQSNARDASLVRNALYPIAFLTAADELEAARLRFLKSGSAADARAYERQAALAASAYTQDLSKFNAAFQEAVPVHSGSYATERFIVNRGDILRAIGSLMRGAQATQGSITKRSLCIRGITVACDPADIQIPSVRVTATPQTTAAQQAIIDRVRHLYARVLASLGREAYGPHSPLVHLSTSACIAPRPNAALVFNTDSFIPLPDSPPELRGIPRGTYAGDIVFEKTEGYGQLPFFNYFAAHGIEYVWTKPLTYYECPELQRDQSMIFSIIAIAKFAQRERVSAYASGADAATLASIERRFASNSAALTEEDATQYLSATRRLMLEDRVPESVSAAYMQLALALSDGTAGLNETINTSVFIDMANAAVAQHGVEYDVSARNLFFVRSAFAVLFMENNPSVAGAHAHLFPQNTLPEDEQPYVYYSDLPNTAAVQENVFRATAFYYGLHI